MAVDHLYITLEGYIRQDQFDRAYELMSPAYRQTHTLEDFASHVRFLKNEYYRLHPQRELAVNHDSATLSPRGGAYDVDLKFQKIEGKWYFTGEYVFYSD